MTYNNSNPQSRVKDSSDVVSMNELPIIQQGDNVLIDARMVHQKLKVAHRFNDWMRNRIQEYGFKPNVDFFSMIDSPDLGNQKFDYSNFSNQKFKGRGGDRRSIKIHLTLDMAKHLCMVERNEQGRAMRRYFIEAEKKLRGIVSIGKEREVLKGLKPRKINDRVLWPYREVLARTGYSVKSSCSGRRHRYWGQFVKEGNLLYCTDFIVTMLYTNRQAMNRRAEALQAQPVLPLNFGCPGELAGEKGGRHE